MTNPQPNNNVGHNSTSPIENYAQDSFHFSRKPNIKNHSNSVDLLNLIIITTPKPCPPFPAPTTVLCTFFICKCFPRSDLSSIQSLPKFLHKMQSEQRRKKKRFPKLKLKLTSHYYFFKYCAMFLFLSFFLIFHGFHGFSDSFPKPLLTSLSMVFQRISTNNSISELRIEDRVLFPDHLLILVSKNSRNKGLECFYSSNSSSLVVHPVLSVDEYTELQSIVRCPLPSSSSSNYSGLVHLRKSNGLVMVEEEDREREMHSWEMLVYAAVIDGETVVVFVKGLNLRPDRISDPSQFRCRFSWFDLEENRNYTRTMNAVTAAQEIIRCSLPVILRKDPAVHGVHVTVAMKANPGLRTLIRSRRQGRFSMFYPPIPSIAKIDITHFNFKQQPRKEQYELCVCTMLWNQAPSLREWIVYHAWLGVQRWFIYDNNSDDEIEKTINELDQENYNVSRHVWPWIKSQEAGFSHCVLRARSECKWVAFMDVDEFYYFPSPAFYHGKTSVVVYPGQNSLLSLVTKYSSTKRIGEIRTVCHSFGPSGLVSAPSQGVTTGYTCRLQSPERHKSIVRPDAIEETLLTVVHHFHLRRGYRYLNLPQHIAVINHYKYQVWEVFRSKFHRRVATYVTDWQENQNEGSKDRAPGLGTEPIEPRNWSRQFCEVWDTGLRDFVIANLAEPISRSLPWE